MIRLLAPILAIAFCSSANGEDLELRYEHLPSLIREKNNHFRAARGLESAAQTETGYLGRSYFPVIKASAAQERSRTGTLSARTETIGSVQAELNLYNGGRDANEDEKLGAQAKSASAELRRTFHDELTKTRKEYWAMVYQKELVVILKEAIEHNDKNLSAANQRIAAGLASKTDRIEFEMNRVSLEQDLSRCILGWQNAERRLKALIGAESSTSLKVVDAIPHEHEDLLLERKLIPERHQSVESLQFQSLQFSLTGDQVRRWWAPSIDLYGSYALYPYREREFDHSADRTEVVGGVRLSFTLFDGLQSQRQASSYRLRSKALEDQARQVAVELSADYESARTELELIHQLIHSAERGTSQGGVYLAHTLSEYRRGQKNSPDVLGATSKWVELRRRYADLRRDYQVSKAELMGLLGE